MRKILSLIILKRIESKVNKYVGPTQHEYENRIGCEEVVWSQAILTSVVLRKKWSFHKMGIDMSRAFDTKKKVVLNLLNDAGCTNDDISLVRYILADTKLCIKINKSRLEELEITLGSGQVDSLSGKLFTLYLAGALHHLRATLKRPHPTVSEDFMPLESEYVDDCDCFSESQEKLKQTLLKIEKVLDEWNLKVNPSKTEYVHYFLKDDLKKKKRGKLEKE